MNCMLMIALIPALLSQSDAPPASQDDDLASLEAVWNQAHLQGDANTLDRLWVDSIVVIVPRMPPFTKSEALSVFRSGRMKFQRYETSLITVRRYEGFAVVTGRLERSRTMSERVVSDDWRFTKVYIRKPAGWQVVSFHASEAGQ